MASDLQDRAAVDRYTSNIMSGSEGSKDYIREFIDVVHALRGMSSTPGTRVTPRTTTSVSRVTS